ncbi:hypothetical protein Tco_1435110 [Tanacetum coccineum]
MTESPFVDSSFAVPLFSPGDDLIACLNKAMAFLTAVASSSTGYKSNATSSRENNASGQAKVVKCYNYQAEAQEAGQILDEEQLTFLADLGVLDGQVVQTIIPNNAAFQTEDLDIYDFDCDDISNAKAVLMANISNYGYDVISEVPHSETYLNDMENQGVHAMQNFKQTPVVDFTENEIHSDSNIIISREKMIDSQMDDMIKEKLALKEQVDSLEQNLSKQIKEKKCLLQTFTVFKSESKEKEDKYMENEIDLEKKIKELDNIITNKPSDVSPVKIEAPKELPKVSLVNESLEKLKFHLARIDNMVKIRTTPDAHT